MLRYGFIGGGEVLFKAEDALQSTDPEGTGLELLHWGFTPCLAFPSRVNGGERVSLRFGEVLACVS